MSWTSGKKVRDWSVEDGAYAVYPYTGAAGAPIGEDDVAVAAHFWRFRALLRNRSVFGKSPEARGDKWFGHLERYVDRLVEPQALCFAEVATHNQFAYVEKPRLFDKAAPVLKLLPGASPRDYMLLLGALNSSALAFWMREMFQVKGGESTGKKRQSEAWARRLARDCTKMKRAPIPKAYVDRIAELAGRCHALAVQVTELRPVAILSADWTPDSLTSRLEEAQRRLREVRNAMIALQEEIDWTVYVALGLAAQDELVPLENVSALASEHRPFAIQLAREVAAGRATRHWFDAMGVTPCVDLPGEYDTATRDRIGRRLALINSSTDIATLESPECKRKWEPISYAAEATSACFDWLSAHVEDAVRQRGKPAPIEQIIGMVQGDARFLAAAAFFQGRRDVDLVGLVTEIVTTQAVPQHPLHVYTGAGLSKRAVWEEIWALQRKEDAGTRVDAFPTPKEYSQGSRGKSTDFLRTEYWRLRGRLDVAAERFISLTEVPGRASTELLYGWAGWTPSQRLRANLVVDEELEDSGIPLADRIGLLDSAWRLLPDVAREDPAAAARLKAELQALVGPEGPSRELIDDWKKRFPPPTVRATRTRRAAAPREDEDDSDTEESDES